jgi:hypothetical protein
MFSVADQFIKIPYATCIISCHDFHSPACHSVLLSQANESVRAVHAGVFIFGRLKLRARDGCAL